MPSAMNFRRQRCICLFFFVFVLGACTRSVSVPGTAARSVSPSPMAVMKSGDAALVRKMYAEALATYLWCLDHGEEVDPAFAGVRGSFLMSRLKSLSKEYPPTIEALRSRRDIIEKKLRDSHTRQDVDGGILYKLNNALGEQQRSLGIFLEVCEEDETAACDSLFSYLAEDLLYQRNHTVLLRFEERLRQRFLGWLRSIRVTRRVGLRAGLEGLATVCAQESDFEAIRLAIRIAEFAPAPDTYAKVMKQMHSAGCGKLATIIAAHGLRRYPDNADFKTSEVLPGDNALKPAHTMREGKAIDDFAEREKLLTYILTRGAYPALTYLEVLLAEGRHEKAAEVIDNILQIDHTETMCGQLGVVASRVSAYELMNARIQGWLEHKARAR